MLENPCQLRIPRREHSTIDSNIIILHLPSTLPPLTLSIHETLLLSTSPFFRTALSPKWSAPSQSPRQITLAHDSPDIVTAFAHWLYFRTIPSKPIRPPPLPHDDGEYLLLARMYVFGEKIQSDEFCDAVLDAMVLKTDDVADGDGTRTFPSHEAVRELYEGTPVGSPARRFVVDMYVEFGDEGWIPRGDGDGDGEGSNHEEFLVDLCRRFLKCGKKGRSRRGDGERYKVANFPRRRTWHKGVDVEVEDAGAEVVGEWGGEFLRMDAEGSMGSARRRKRLVLE